jgi:hypothetical protein
MLITGTYKNDARVVRFAVQRLEELVRQINATVPEDPARNALLQFQPITEPMVAQGRGLNSLGMEEEIAGGPGIMTDILLQTSSPEAEAVVHALTLDFQRDIDEYAASIGASWEWRYLNYADLSVDAIASYGIESVERLRAVSAQYDPESVFQLLRKSGHKLPA